MEQTILTRLFLFLILVHLLKGVYSQTIALDQFDITQSQTKCKKGLLIGDQVVFTGTADATLTADPSLWPLNVLLQRYETDPSQLKIICNVDTACNGYISNTACYCTKKVGNTFFFVYNATVQQTLRNSTILAVWNGGYAEVIKSNTLKYPLVYDTPEAKITVDQKDLAVSDTLDVGLYKNVAAQFIFCVTNLESPVLKMDFDSANSYSYQGECLEKSIVPTDAHVSTGYIFSYTDGCDRGSSIFLNITVKDAGKTDGLSGPEKLGLILGVIFGAIMILAIILIVICIRCKRCCRCCEEAFGCKKVPVKMKCCTTDVTCSLFCCCVKEALPGTEVTQPEHTLPLKETNKQPNTEAKLNAVNKHVVSSRPLPPLQTLHIPPTRISPEATENNETPKKKRGKKKKSKKNTTEIV